MLYSRVLFVRVSGTVISFAVRPLINKNRVKLIAYFSLSSNSNSSDLLVNQDDNIIRRKFKNLNLFVLDNFLLLLGQKSKETRS